MTKPRALCMAFSLMLTAGCSGNSTSPGEGPVITEPCTFANPVMVGADPWVVRHDGFYYLVQSRDNGIWVYKSSKLTELSSNGVRVWSAPISGWNSSHIWAPELHFIDGRWYIYYTGGAAGPPFIHQRSGVLESTTADPQGSYVDKGMLYTGDDVASGADNKWAIDLTVARLGNQLYAVWSGWEANAATDRTPQHLYIARMSNPTTISSNRVKLSSPQEIWELGTELNLQEGPQFLMHGSDIFIIYSTRESWLKDYRLGQLRLAAGAADPMNPASWTKTGPVFTGTPQVHGVGHASFTTSPNGSEDWIVYHSKVDVQPGWNRVIRTQKFTWNSDGSPNFGMPVESGKAIAAPAGQCAT